jgi:hypothetical protein
VLAVGAGGAAPAWAADPAHHGRPVGASSTAPRQRDGRAPSSGDHQVAASATDAGLAVAGRKPVSPAGTVPHRLAVPDVVRVVQARERLTKPKMSRTGAVKGYDAKTSKLVATPDAATRIFQNADGTLTAQIAAGQINAGDDTFVMSGQGDESNSPDLQVGSDDGGAHIGRAYLNFSGLASGALTNKYVNGAALTLYDT